MSLMEYPDLIKLREAITQDARIKLQSGLTSPIKVPSQRNVDAYIETPL